MSRIDACDAVYRFLGWAIAQDDVPFVRRLDEPHRGEAMSYLRGLAEHARLHRSVPVIEEGQP